jgi:hypothetical protein
VLRPDRPRHDEEFSKVVQELRDAEALSGVVL